MKGNTIFHIRETPQNRNPTSHTLLPHCPRTGPCELTRIVSVLTCKLLLVFPFYNPPSRAVSHPLCPTALTASYQPSLHSKYMAPALCSSPIQRPPPSPTQEVYTDLHAWNQRLLLTFHSTLPACLPVQIPFYHELYKPPTSIMVSTSGL